METFSKASIALLENNQSLKKAVGIIYTLWSLLSLWRFLTIFLFLDTISDSIMYMNDQQHNQYDRSSKEIEDIKTTLKTMPDSVKLSVGSHLESRVEALNKEIQTLIDDTHKVSLSHDYY